MAGYMIAEVWCEDCSLRVVAEDEGGLREHRAYLRDDGGWHRVRRGGELIDLCPECFDVWEVA